MSIQHAAITDPDIHEPKGASTANSGEVYVADGAGSGVWTPSSRFAELYISAGSGTQALTSTAARLDPSTNWVAGVTNGVTQNATDGTLTIVTAGTYAMSFWITLTTDSVASGTTYTFYYAINGTPNTRSVAVAKNTAGADKVTCSATGLVTLSASDVVSIYAKSSINSTITVNDAGFNVHKV